LIHVEVFGNYLASVLSGFSSAQHTRGGSTEARISRIAVIIIDEWDINLLEDASEIATFAGGACIKILLVYIVHE
jgi:hypothetical protein